MRLTRVAGLLAGVVLVGAITACASSSPVSKFPSPSDLHSVDWHARLTAFVAKYGTNPKADPPLTDAQAHDVSAQWASRNWAAILKQYPLAVRPTDSFIHWAANNDPDVAACDAAAGATADSGTAADGTVSQGFSGPATAEFAAASFACEFNRYPVRPSPSPNDAQLSYYYDYLVAYLVPCYHAHSAKIDLGMPTRQSFIAQNQANYSGNRWQLTPPDAADAPDATYDGTSAVCSATGPGGAQQ
jgi:hypothetical protein